MRFDFLNFVLVGVIILLFLSWFGGFSGIQGILISLNDQASAATSAAVTVSASITASLSCATATGTTAFGTLTSATVATSTPNSSTSISCVNGAAGCTLYINDTGSTTRPGLWNSTAGALIESPNVAYDASATLAAGTEGYGVTASTTANGTGAALGIDLRYRADLMGANGVGGLTTTTLTIASTTATTSAREVLVVHRAAINDVTPGGSYTDTITYSCISN